MTHLQNANVDLLPKEMNIYLNVSSTTMLHWIFALVCDNDVVTKQLWNYQETDEAQATSEASFFFRCRGLLLVADGKGWCWGGRVAVVVAVSTSIVGKGLAPANFNFSIAGKEATCVPLTRGSLGIEEGDESGRTSCMCRCVSSLNLSRECIAVDRLVRLHLASGLGLLTSSCLCEEKWTATVIMRQIVVDALHAHIWCHCCTVTQHLNQIKPHCCAISLLHRVHNEKWRDTPQPHQKEQLTHYGV
jgi:hypothetical protein